MAILSTIIYFSSALLATQRVLAAPTRRDACDFGIATPANWQPIYNTQWCGMINNEVAGLTSKEDPTTMLPTLRAIFAQAGITASPSSSLPNIDAIMQDPQARAAMTQMKANYPASGSMDLTTGDIQTVYAEGIQAASDKTGVPQDMLVNIIWTESKGHPLVYQGLTQIDYVGWGQQVDRDSSLQNRYMPSDNILAAAMYLKAAKEEYGGDWSTTYTQHYQDPGAAARAS